VLVVPPTDAADEELDVDGLPTASIARTQAWLARLLRGARRAPLRRAARLRAPEEVYLAYLGAFGASSCGLADRGGKAGLVWLTCALGHPTNAPFSLIDSVAMHETLHALGAVDDCSAEPGTGLTAQGAPRPASCARNLNGVETGRVSVKCSAKLGKRSLRVLFARYAGRVARCGFAVGARRGFVTGKITARSGTAVATRSFQLRA
jgi:hypothetical protein